MQLPRLNTKQLIALWYGAVVIGGIFLAKEQFILAALTITAVLIYSLGRHPEARKKLVIAWVAGPLVVLPAAGAAWFYVEDELRERKRARERRLIPPAEVELLEFKIANWGFTCGSLTGRLKNKSQFPLHSVNVRIIFYDQVSTIAEQSQTIEVAVPPGDTRAFSESFCQNDLPSKGWEWKYEIRSAEGSTSR